MFTLIGYSRLSLNENKATKTASHEVTLEEFKVSKGGSSASAFKRNADR